MKTYIYILVFWISISNLFGQTIKELEHDLSFYLSSEKYGDKIDKARKLLELDHFNYNAVEYICRYYSDRKIDSVSIFFDNLATQYPEKVEPFILRTQLLFLEYDFSNKKEYTKWKIKYLDSALKIDKSDSRVLYYLAETYYEDFILPFEKERDYGFVFDSNMLDTTIVKRNFEVKQSTVLHSADSALKYLYNLWENDKKLRDIIFFPIRQLECYLSISNSHITENILQSNDYCYFPPWYFANLGKDWECNNSINYLFELKLSKGNSDGFTTQLVDLNEPCLFNQNVGVDFESYRFTWLRSFDNPISIRIQKDENNIILYWKVGKGAGGYEPKGIKKSGKKKISESKWIEFIDLVNKAKFDSLPNDSYIPMTDGATWTLERKTNKNFKAHNTNWPSDEFKESCLFLLKLSNIKVKKNDIY